MPVLFYLWMPVTLRMRKSVRMLLTFGMSKLQGGD